jgi:hypothetical protein
MRAWVVLALVSGCGGEDESSQFTPTSVTASNDGGVADANVGPGSPRTRTRPVVPKQRLPDEP